MASVTIGGNPLYGMVHNGIRAMAVERLGEKEWLRIEREARIGPSEFIGLTVYDDAMTFRIVQIAARALDLPLDACLRQFGRHWIIFAQNGSFGAIMDFTGNNLISFISNLDRMHRAVAATMPGSSLPSFTIHHQCATSLSILYRSDRIGLEQFVIGLLEGLLEKFKTAGSVHHNGPIENGCQQFTILLN